MSYVMVDVEADGPIPGDYSMICFGAIVVEPSLDRTFYGKLKSISDKWIPEALSSKSSDRWSYPEGIESFSPGLRRSRYPG
jgi:hypothetical protein